MRKRPLITVYITNYNYEQFIRTAVESVLNQTLQDFELIIIDDGSTDNSKQIIESYEHLKNVSVIFQKNRGLNITNNVALKASRGKYIVRLDADDYLELNALERMSSILEEEDDLGLIFPDYYMVDVEGNLLSEIKRHDFSNEVNILDQPAHGACTMIRTDFLKEVGGYDETYTCQDGYELWVKFINKFRVTNINETLFSYRRHGHNLTNNENRILGTRLKIKEAYVKRNKVSLPPAAGIIPLRPDYDLALETFGTSTFLDHKIKTLLGAENIQKVLVTSSDLTIKQHIHKRYDDSVQFISRPEQLERINVSLFSTMKHLHNVKALEHMKAYLFSSVTYPFVDSKILNDAINTLAIFKADSLVSVRPESNKFYRHTGNGMETILQQDNFTKLEREAIYRYTGGIIAGIIDSSLEKGQLVQGNVGHVVISEKAALNVESEFEKHICHQLITDLEKLKIS